MRNTFSTLTATAMIAFAAGLVTVDTAHAQQRVRVEVSNNSPDGGVVLTPVWAGFHDGSFDLFEVGSASSAGLESIAEDGAVGTLSSEFNAVAGRVDANTEGGIAIASPTGPGPVQPGETESRLFDLSTDGSNSFFSFATMVLISNDYFAGNNNAIDISSVLSGGGPVTVQVGVPGERRLYDAGTEVNDFAFSAANGAPFFGLGGGQTGPNQSGPLADTGFVSTISAAGDPFSGFANADLLGPGGVPANFNFNDTALYSGGIATITISAIPEPGSLSLLGLAASCGLLRRRR